MSTTVSAVPFLLIYSLATGVIEGLKAVKTENLHLEESEMDKLFNQDFQTQIMDKSVLIKTLKEHGAENIEESFGNISCDCEQFHIKFTYNGENPYTMNVSARSGYGIDEFVADIGSEYTANAQEVSYNKIKERLEKQNLTIDNEEIYDDNTIVLTVNLD